jgi:fructose-specific phosphotransferase system IIA component
MILTQILQPGCLKVPVESKNKEDAILELVDLLFKSEAFKNKETVVNSVLSREKTRSTGIGSGIAIPHGKCNTVKELVMAVGIAHDPIEFLSVDGEPVKIILLLVSPADQTGPHIQALARISKLMLDDEFKRNLENAESADQAYKLLSERDALQ